MNDTRRSLLIVGGTSEAMAVARLLKDEARVTMSLVGMTQARLPDGVGLHQGGFGGVGGLEAYVRDKGVAAIVDGSHPFATTMRASVTAVAKKLNVPRIALVRIWHKRCDDQWVNCASREEALPMIIQHMKHLHGGVFLSVGGRGALAWRDDLADAPVVVRTMGIASPSVPPSWRWLLGAPADEESEVAFFRKHDIELLVSRHSGGTRSYGKIAAARRLGITVVMLDAPPPPPPPLFSHEDEAVRWYRSLGTKDMAMGGVIQRAVGLGRVRQNG